MGDILTVMWKERKGLFRQRGSRARALFGLLVPVAVLAIYMPLSMGREWVDTYWSLIASVLVPMILVGMAIPDSIAGERERHTLPTLLASRLPDRAILFGKIAVAVAYAWAATLLVLLLALVPLNIAHWDGQLMLYSPSAILVDVAFSILAATFVAAAGVLISLRAATAQEAQQTLMAAVMFPPLLLGFVPMLLISLKPEWMDSIVEALSTIGATQFILMVAAVLVVACLGLLWAAMGRFRRARLILS